MLDFTVEGTRDVFSSEKEIERRHERSIQASGNRLVILV